MTDERRLRNMIPAMMYPMLFAGAFKCHHKRAPKDTIDRIYKQLKGKEELAEELRAKAVGAGWPRVPLEGGPGAVSGRTACGSWVCSGLTEQHLLSWAPCPPRPALG